MATTSYGPWRLQFVDRSESSDKQWVNSETGETMQDTPEVQQAIASGAKNLYAEPGQEEQFNRSGNIWNPATGQYDARNPYTTERAQLEKMLQTTGPHAGQYVYLGPNGFATYDLNQFNKVSGTNYTQDQIPDLGHNLDAEKGNDTSGFDRAYQNVGDLGIEAIRGVLGYQSGGASELLFGLAGPNDNDRDRRAARTGVLGGLTSILTGGPSSGSSGNIGDAETGVDYGGNLGGSSGTETLGGNAAGDTLSADPQFDPYTGDQVGYSGNFQGGEMDNYFGDYIDPDTGFNSYAPDTTSADVSGGVDEFGNPTSGDLNFSGGNTNDFFSGFASGSSGIDWQGLAKKYGVTAAKQLYGALTGGSGNNRQTVGQGILGQLTGDPLGSLFSATPFLLALNEANKQGGDINDTVGRLRSLEDSVSGNSSPYMNAVLNPYDQQTGVGRAAMVQDQSLRGVRGSSFGDQSLNSYDYTRGVGRGDIASKALLGSTALQGNLIGSELDAITKRNTNRNLLLGAGLSASGRLFQPEKDPFNLSTLLGL